jgi:hypothetical protein
MKKKLLDSINVKIPCYESWEKMSGNDEVRFCSHCEKDIYNLSEMNRVEAEKLVKTSKGKICVRYVKTPQGKFITNLPKLHKITRQAMTAGALVTTLSLSALAYSQDTIKSSNNYSDTSSEIIISDSGQCKTGVQNADSKNSGKTIKKGKKSKKKAITKKGKSLSKKTTATMGILW